VVAVPLQTHLHYLYYSDRYYFELCFLEREVQDLQAVEVLQAQLEPLPVVMGQILQMFSLQLAPIDRW
jgi:hypothetical protein